MQFGGPGQFGEGDGDIHVAFRKIFPHCGIIANRAVTITERGSRTVAPVQLHALIRTVGGAHSTNSDAVKVLETMATGHKDASPTKAAVEAFARLKK